MSIEKISGLVHGMAEIDDTLTDANNCRGSVTKIADKIKINFPNAEVSFLAYPEVREGENVHYSILVTSENQKMVVNLVEAPGFPQYIGGLDSAFPTFSVMKKSDIVL